MKESKTLKIVPFDIFENKANINWKEENKLLVIHEELKFLHKSDFFIHPCECHNEICHRYCIGKEIFFNKSMKCKSCGKFLKISFKNNTIFKKSKSVIILCIIAIIYSIITLGCILWIVFSALSAMNSYQISLNCSSAAIIFILTTIFFVKTIRNMQSSVPVKYAYCINSSSKEKHSKFETKRLLTDIFKSTLQEFCKTAAYDEKVISSFVKQKTIRRLSKIIEKESKLKVVESSKQLNQKNTDENVNIETNMKNNSKAEEEKKAEEQKKSTVIQESHTNFDLWMLNLPEHIGGTKERFLLNKLQKYDKQNEEELFSFGNEGSLASYKNMDNLQEEKIQMNQLNNSIMIRTNSKLSQNTNSGSNKNSSNQNNAKELMKSMLKKKSTMLFIQENQDRAKFQNSHIIKTKPQKEETTVIAQPTSNFNRRTTLMPDFRSNLLNRSSQQKQKDENKKETK